MVSNCAGGRGRLDWSGSTRERAAVRSALRLGVYEA